MKFTTDDNSSVLIVSDHTNPVKIERHWEPLAEVVDEVTMVCVSPNENIDTINYKSPPRTGNRIVSLLLLFPIAIRECLGNNYDLIAAISIRPYGLYSLILGFMFDIPTHLGIIGADLDRHAVAWYGPVFQWLFARFTTLSVPGTPHKQELIEIGIPESRVHILKNCIDTTKYKPQVDRGPKTYDFVWLGRFSSEKQPLLFVKALSHLKSSGYDFSAVMIGKGGLFGDVQTAIEAYGLSDEICTLGWVDEPFEYYVESKVYVLTSAREGLPLTLVEAMAVGRPSVVPDVGSVTDVVIDGKTGLVVQNFTPENLSAALARVLENDELHRRLTANAPLIRKQYSKENASQDWMRIIESNRTRSTSLEDVSRE